MLKLALILTAPLVCSSIIFIQGSMTWRYRRCFGGTIRPRLNSVGLGTGPDRAAGVDGNDPGTARGFPLHATMPAAEKLESLRGLPTRWPQGIRRKARLAFGDDEWALIEV